MACSSLRAAALPYYSALRGGPVDEEAPAERGYWLDHLTETVRFDEAVRAALEPHSSSWMITLGWLALCFGATGSPPKRP